MLRFDSKDDIKKIIPFLQSFMIREHEPKEVKELFSIVVYLYANNKLDQLTFPFELVKRESPDFSVLCYDVDLSRGIEHTLSTLQDYKMALSELQKLPEFSKLEPSYYSPFNKLSKGEAFVGIKQPSQPLDGSGYNGERPEFEWAEIVKNAIINKTILLNKEHYEKFSTNELIINGNSPTENFINLDTALAFLEPHIKEYLFSGFNIKYNQVHILSKNTFVYDILSKNKKIRFSIDLLNEEYRWG